MDATQEEARDGGEVVDRLTGGETRFEAIEVGIRHGAITVGREQERDVDVDSPGDGVANSGQTRFGARNFDHRIRSPYPCPYALRLGDRALGVICWRCL